MFIYQIFLSIFTYLDLSKNDNFENEEFKELVSFLKGVKKIKPKINPSPEFQNFLNNEQDQLSYFTNISLNRKSNLVSRNIKTVVNVSTYFEENKFKDASLVKPVLLKTWSGEGKTTIALEFAYKQGINFISSIFIDASRSIDTQLANMADMKFKVKLPSHIDSLNAIKFKVDYVKDYVNAHASLLIFDNVTEVEDIEKYLPKKGQSRSIILTTNFKISSLDFS
ncbi:MAG: hypothetical protein IPL25_19115 [Saprospiraceae bacterium]|nr:hypothetical protein [Candidatus Vicinibacter affinis]